MTRPNPKRAMEPVGGNCIGGKKLPTWEDLLHDLKTMSDPIDAAEQSTFVHAGGWRCSQSKHDLRFDARFGQGAQRSTHTPLRQVTHRTIVEVSPHRSMNVVFGPDCPVGETDLAPDWPLAPRLALRAN